MIYCCEHHGSEYPMFVAFQTVRKLVSQTWTPGQCCEVGKRRKKNSRITLPTRCGEARVTTCEALSVTEREERDCRWLLLLLCTTHPSGLPDGDVVLDADHVAGKQGQGSAGKCAWSACSVVGSKCYSARLYSRFVRLRPSLVLLFSSLQDKIQESRSSRVCGIAAS